MLHGVHGVTGAWTRGDPQISQITQIQNEPSKTNLNLRHLRNLWTLVSYFFILSRGLLRALCMNWCFSGIVAVSFECGIVSLWRGGFGEGVVEDHSEGHRDELGCGDEGLCAQGREVFAVEVVCVCAGECFLDLPDGVRRV
jgi:hypothetical protein